jgi:hypothetical protein
MADVLCSTQRCQRDNSDAVTKKTRLHVRTRSCIFGQNASKMLLPNPSYCFCSVVLVACKPELALHANDVEDLARYVNKVWNTAFAAVVCNIELEETCSEKEDFGLVCVARRGRELFD